MENEKKYWYPVGNYAEGESFGWVQLTEEEAKIINFVSDSRNWTRPDLDAYSGGFWIGLDYKQITEPTDSAREIWDNC